MNAPIFISGCPRSGTSILGFLIGKNNQIFSYLEPSGFYRYFNEIFLKYPIPLLLFKKIFAGKISSSIVYSVSVSKQTIPSYVQPELFFSKKELVRKMKILEGYSQKNECLEIYGRFAESVFGDFARYCQKERWCVKKPNYLYANIDKIYRIHPNMKFINIVRDGRDVIASLMKQKWNKKNTFKNCLNVWMQILELGNRKCRSVPVDNFLTVRLEDVLSSTDRELEKICQFIDVDYDQGMQIYAKQNLNLDSVGRWQTELTLKQKEIIIHKGGHLLKRYGYL
ncbi:MAG: sulfotransferase [Coleofasciculus sp. C1-SOL-03]|uniref:sulfotransferase family protein n=1 Tax=Coleofasciculus sp. C1-SOL-03 TaxID=3069522 RepID=UPI0032F2C4B6